MSGVWYGARHVDRSNTRGLHPIAIDRLEQYSVAQLSRGVTWAIAYFPFASIDRRR
jgi:hypothetical protein